MVLELHVWGPAFGLPSIDPQCLAAIAYFALAVPAKRAGGDVGGVGGGREEEWVLVADSDPGKVPTSMFFSFLILFSSFFWVGGVSGEGTSGHDILDGLVWINLCLVFP